MVSQRPDQIVDYLNEGTIQFDSSSTSDVQFENRDRAIIACQVTNSALANDHVLDELNELAISAGAVVCARIVSVRSKPVAATFFGKGKVEELASIVAYNCASLVIFDHSISPVQERNIERQIQCRVLDRAGLILSIFAQRATSMEGKLQVELAQLRHLSTRLVRGWSHLERQKGGIGLRGPGESQLETDRRLIGQRIRTLSSRLERVESQRKLRRRARQRAPVATISLVGYTNAGKSTLFNVLTGANTLSDNRLFATLDPTMRRLELPKAGTVVLSDTVGFVRDLPHSLIASFKSTLEEVLNSTYLLLVTDISASDSQETRMHVRDVLKEIGADNIPVIHVLNKIDLINETPKVIYNSNNVPDSVMLSAMTGKGLDLLIKAIASQVSKEYVQYRIELKPDAGKLRSKLFQRCEVLQETYLDNGGMVLDVKMCDSTMGWLMSQQNFTGKWSQVI
ncbi:MAG: GTPase HflX [Gammaproteobacteria bacterium]|nr:GTPase HflX [Gammaproteobacteria bacterium]MCY4218623.1 GTPase HflX [Gammaproteobacteria bacterium]MCY4275369.1 GTPase HflX [Gammaproteobacteria bacterium]